MRSQAWLGTVLFTLIAFAGGYVAGVRRPNSGPARATGTTAPDVAGRCFFSPGGGCTQAIVAEIAAAQHSIALEGRSFTSETLGQALMAAHRRGVDVTLVLDAAATGDDRAEAQALAAAGLNLFLDSKHAHFRDQVILIDARTLITGGFGFTPSSDEADAANVLILHDQPQLQSAYEDDFRKHLAQSERFDGK